MRAIVTPRAPDRRRRSVNLGTLERQVERSGCILGRPSPRTAAFVPTARQNGAAPNAEMAQNVLSVSLGRDEMLVEHHLFVVRPALLPGDLGEEAAVNQADANS